MPTSPLPQAASWHEVMHPALPTEPSEKYMGNVVFSRNMNGEYEWKMILVGMS